MIKAGNYKARIGDYGVKATNAGAPSLVVRFDALVPGEGELQNPVYWRGYFSEKALPHTEKNLETLGFQGQLVDLADGPSGRALNDEKVYEVVVIHEVSEQTGKSFPIVRFINDPDRGVIGKVSKVEAMQLFAGITLSKPFKKDEPIPF
jgi:hypothetical protein